MHLDADIGIIIRFIGAHRIQHGLAHFIARRRIIEAHEFHALIQAHEMFLQPKDRKLLGGWVHIGANAFKHRAAISVADRKGMHARFIKGDLLAVLDDVFCCPGHWFPHLSLEVFASTSSKPPWPVSAAQAL